MGLKKLIRKAAKDETVKQLAPLALPVVASAAWKLFGKLTKKRDVG